ncbi:MAG: hypothetical protein QXW79_01085 [Thermoplasmata archaeon]
MSSINVLFYSNHCESSKHLISLMQSENLLRFFYLVCIDNQNVTKKNCSSNEQNLNMEECSWNKHFFSEQIRVTPTLIIRGVSTPYVGGDAFVWFSKIKQWKINMMMQKMSNAQKQYLQTINNNLEQNERLLGFSKAEMDGMSDIFAYLSSETPVPHTYFAYDQIGRENIFTPPLEDGHYKVSSIAKYKINSSKQKELCSNLEVERKKQDELFKRSIEEFKKQITKN